MPNRVTTDAELWSTIDINLGDPFPIVPLVWFSYGLSQQVANSTRLATQADTNLMRDGNSGLPQDFKMRVQGWRARAIAPQAVLRSDAWWYWCATVAVQMYINTRRVVEWTLDELLRAPRVREGATAPGRFAIPIDLPMQIGYEVRLIPTDGRKAEAARAIAIAANPAHTVLPPELWNPIKLRCYLRGEYTQVAY